MHSAIVAMQLLVPIRYILKNNLSTLTEYKYLPNEEYNAVRRNDFKSIMGGHLYLVD